MLKEIKIEDFKHVYDKLVNSLHEFKKVGYEQYLKIIKNGRFKCLLFYVDDIEVGYLLGYIFKDLYKENIKFQNRDGYFYLDHIEIYKEYQNKGYGHILMTELMMKNFTKKGILFELISEKNNNSVKNLPNYDHLAFYKEYKLDRFFNAFSQQPLEDYDLEIMYPNKDYSQFDIFLRCILNPNTITTNYELLDLIVEAKSYIYQDMNVKKDIISSFDYYYSMKSDIRYGYKYNIRNLNLNNIDKYNDLSKLQKGNVIHAIFYGLLDELKLFNEDFENNHSYFDITKELLNTNTIFNYNNFYEIYKEDKDGILTDSVILLINNQIKDDRNEIIKTFNKLNLQISSYLDRMIFEINSYKMKLKNNERRIIFIHSAGDYQKSFVLDNILPLLPRDYTYYVDIDLKDSYKIMQFSQNGFITNKNKNNIVELIKKHK